MTKSVASLAVSIGVLVLLADPPMTFAQERPAAAPTMSGEWKVSLHGGHVIPVGMELSQDGDKVTGTLMMWNGEIELAGNFTDGKLTVSGVHTPTDGTPGGTRTVSVTVQPDGTLLGTFAWNEKQAMKLTAERFNARAARPRPTTMTTVAAKDLSAFAGKWALAVGPEANAQKADLDTNVAGGQMTGTVFIDHAGLLQIRNAALKDGTLTFEVRTSDTAAPAVFSIKLTDNGSLTGTVKGPMGEMPFTGRRAH